MHKRVGKLIGSMLLALVAGCGGAEKVATVTGRVQVALTPAAAVSAGAGWTLDSAPTVYANGATVSVAVGSHTVHPVSPGGWTASEVAVSVTANNSTPATLTFTAVPVGQLQVNLAPAAAVTAGARWTLDAGSTPHASGESLGNVSVGSHTLHFSAVSGWTAPADATVTVAANTLTTASGTYVQQVGQVQVALAPAAAVSAGARWTLDSDATARVSNALVANVPVGAHTLHFSTVSGYTAPPDQTINVTNAALTFLTATYLVPGGQVSVTLTPAGAVTAGATWTLDADATPHASGATVANVSAGSHTVHFGTVSGYTTPADATVSVTVGNTATTTGSYTARAISFATSVAPLAAACTCHGGTMTNRAVLLSSGRVVPGNAAASSYVQRSGMQGYWGSTANRQTVIDWINQGANP